jgi:cyclic 2,3-diphosphoglycerate synthase
VKNLLRKKDNRHKKLIALIDGEHYPDVTRDALAMLKDCFTGSFAGIVFLGGSEKLVMDDLEEYFGGEVYIISDLDCDFMEALKQFKPDIAYDLSDEPVVDYRSRMKIASFCIASGCSYMGPDFLFESQRSDIRLSVRSLSIIGTGKRIGKTAISSYAAKLYSEEDMDVAILAMGRGGPAEPQVIKGDEIDINPEYLLELNRKGLHASSDYIEDAMLSEITTIGCRRCGGGFAGDIFMTNLEQGARIAESLGPDLLIVEGSGASIPGIDTDARICVIGAFQDWTSIIGYLGIYRIILADLIILTMCEEPMADDNKIVKLEKEIKKYNPGAAVLRTVFRPKPLSNIKGKKVFLAMTASPAIENKIRKYMEKEYGCRVAAASFNLSNRHELRKDLASSPAFDTILTELKAAAVDVLTRYASENKKEVSFIDNIPVVTKRGSSFKKELMGLIR